MTRGRVPAGLTFSMFVAAISLGLMVTCWNLAWPDEPGLPLLAHCGAALCLGWAAFGLIIFRIKPKWRTHLIGLDLQAVLRIAMIVTGLLAMVIMLYAAASEVLYRILRPPVQVVYPPRWYVDIWRSGFIDLGLVAAAVMIGWGRSRNTRLITICFWILGLAGLWLSLQMPEGQIVYTPSGASYVDATQWAVPFVIWNALLIAIFTLAEGIRNHIRRVHAWPNALHRLTARTPAWPGFLYSVGIIAVLLLILGCVHIVSPWITVSAFVAGASIFVLVNRRWEMNLAEIAIGLVTLGLVSLILIIFPKSMEPSPEYYAWLFNRLLFGLAAAVWLWHWLAGVWYQQIDNGKPWTTTGRLIRHVQRIGYLCSVTGVLVSLHLSFWPRFPVVNNLYDFVSLWFGGLSANGLLIVALMSAACRTKKTTLAWLVLFAVMSTFAFTLIRLGDAPFVQWWMLHWPIVMPALAVVCLALRAVVTQSDRWRPFSEPLYLLAIVVAPIAGTAGVLLTGQVASMPQWISPTVFGSLVVVYLIAALLPGPRRLLILAVICAALTVWRLR